MVAIGILQQSPNTCYLYTIEHVSLPIIYIGITDHPDTRKREHYNHSSNTHLRNYIGLYGKHAFTFKIVTQGPRTDMEDLEELAILEAKNLPRIIVCNILIGSVFTGSSSQVGEAHWNSSLTEQDVLRIREIYSKGGTTQKQLGEMFGCSNKVISKITTGSRWDKLGGPIQRNMLKNKAANRRKLSDSQVLQVREMAFTRYTSTGKISVPEIAETYGVSRNSMRMLLRGDTYKALGGKLLGIDYYTNYGRASNGG